jgi:hypothetical protein
MFTNTRHHSLIAWQRADDLFIKLHQLTLQQFPAFETFELGSQLRKAAYSAAANIVEGGCGCSRELVSSVTGCPALPLRPFPPILPIQPFPPSF